MASAAGSVKSAPAAKNDAFVESQLDRARRRIRMLDLATALLGFLAGTLAFGLVMAFLDNLLELPAATRTIAFAGYFLASAVYLGCTVVRPLLWNINPYYAARKVEETLPGAKNSVVNWLDLHAEDLSPAIQQAVSQRAAKDIARADFDKAVSGRRAGWAAGLAGLMFVVLLSMIFSLGARKFFSHLGRAFLPFSAAGPAKRTVITLVEPEDGNVTLSAGQPFSVRVHIDGRVSDQVKLLSGPSEDELDQVQLLEEEDRDRKDWTLLIPGPEVKNGFYYRIAAGDAESDIYRVTVRASPAIVLDSFTVTYKQPAYVGTVVERVQRKQRDLADLRGTQVTLDVPTNRKLRGGKLDILSGGKTLKPIPAVIDNSDPTRMHFSFKLEQSGTYGISFKTVEDESYSDSQLPSVTARPDTAPTLELRKPGIDTSLAAHELLELEGVARDDIGVKELVLRMKVAGQLLQAKPYRSEGELKLADGGYPLVLDYKDFVELAQVKDAAGKPFTLQPDMQLEYWLEAKDACDNPEPNVGESKHYTVTINAIPPDQKKNDERRKKAEQDKENHRKEQDDKLKKEGQKRQDEAKKEADKQEKDRKDEEERQQRAKDQKEGKQPNKPDEKKDPGKGGDEGKEDTRTEKQKEQDNQAAKDLDGVNKEKKQREDADRDKQKAQPKPDKPENPGEGKDDPQKNKEKPEDKKGEQGQNGEAKGNPDKKNDPGKDGAKDAGKPDEKPGEGKKDGDPQGGDEKRGGAKDGQGQQGEPKAAGKEDAQAKRPPQQGGDSKGKPGDKKDGQQAGAGKDNGGMTGDKDAAKPKDAGGMQGAEKDAGQGKGEQKQQPRAEAKGGKEQGQPQASGKGGPKEGDPMANKTGSEKSGAKEGEEKSASAKGDRIKGEKRRPEQEKQTPAELARKKDVEKAAEDLKSGDAADREAARRRLEEIAKDAQDGEAKEEAAKELDKERRGENAAAPKQSVEGKKDGKCAECKGGGQAGGQGAGKEGGQQPGQAQGKGGPQDPNKKNGGGGGTAKGNGDIDPRQTKEEIGKLERAVQGAKDNDGKKRELSKQEIKEAFDKLIEDLKSDDAVRREQARDVLKELERQQRQDKEFDKGLPQDKVNEAKEEAKKGGQGQGGTGGTNPQDNNLDPAKPAANASDNRHRNQAGDLTLRQFNDIVKKGKLKGDWTEDRIENVRRFLKETEDQAKKDGGRAPLGAGKPLGTDGIGQVKPGDGKVKDVGLSDQSLIPPEYREAYREFTKRLQEAQQGAKDK